MLAAFAILFVIFIAMAFQGIIRDQLRQLR